MRGLLLLAFCATLTSCLQQQDGANYPVSLIAPYGTWPDPPSGTTIEAGKPVRLEMSQQQVVINGVIKWMKAPTSVSFGEMAAAQTRRGRIVVCGDVNGRNSAGTYVGMSPFIGVLLGAPKAQEFVVVDIASFGRPRTEIEAMCRDSGVARNGEPKLSRAVP